MPPLTGAGEEMAGGFYKDAAPMALPLPEVSLRALVNNIQYQEPPLSVSRKRQKTAALHDASRPPARRIHAPAFGLRLSSGAFDQQKQPCLGQCPGTASAQ